MECRSAILLVRIPYARRLSVEQVRLDNRSTSEVLRVFSIQRMAGPSIPSNGRNRRDQRSGDNGGTPWYVSGVFSRLCFFVCLYGVAWGF